MKRILILLTLLVPVVLHGQIITTFVDSNKIKNPSGIATDSKNNLYVADAAHNLVYKVDTGGKVTIVAGTGVAGYNGDTLVATAAMLSAPHAVAVSKNGNIYIADHDNRRIRRVDASGIITSVYHFVNTWGFPEDYGEWEPVLIAVNDNEEVYFTQFTSYGPSPQLCKVIRPDSGACLSCGHFDAGGIPSIKFDSSNTLYLSVSAGVAGQVVRLESSGSFSRIYGNGSCGSGCADGVDASSFGFYEISGLAFKGNKMYIAENINSRIIKVEANKIIKFAGVCYEAGHTGDNGNANDADINLGNGALPQYSVMTSDQLGNLFVVEEGYNDIRKITPTGHVGSDTSDMVALNEHVIGIDIFPNPARDEIEIRSQERISSIQISSVLGELIFSKEYRSDNIKVDLSTFSSGIYLVRVNNTIVRKFVKE